MKLPTLALPCSGCGKTFTRQGGLSKHQLTCPRAQVVTSTDPLRIDLDTLPVGINHAYQNITLRSKTGKVYTSRRLTEAAHAWRTIAMHRIKEAAQTAGWAVAENTPLQLRIQFTLPKLYQSDVDGLLKLPLDALKDAIGTDDRYILDLTVGKRRGPEALTLWVQSLPNDQAPAGWGEM